MVIMGSSNVLSKYFALRARKIFSKYPIVLLLFTVDFIFDISFQFDAGELRTLAGR